MTMPTTSPDEMSETVADRLLNAGAREFLHGYYHSRFESIYPHTSMSASTRTGEYERPYIEALERRLNRAEGLEARLMEQIEANIDDEYTGPDYDLDSWDIAQDIKERVRWAFDPSNTNNTPIAAVREEGSRSE